MIERNVVDAYHVEQLVHAMHVALEHACVADVTTPADVLSAIFTTLERTLYALQSVESSFEEREHNRKEVANALNDLMMSFGMKTH
jgi:hypothetical protein